MTLLLVIRCAGFPFADVPFVGPTVTVTFLDDAAAQNAFASDSTPSHATAPDFMVSHAEALAEAAAAAVAKEVWRDRSAVSSALLSPAEAAAQAARFEAVNAKVSSAAAVEAIAQVAVVAAAAAEVTATPSIPVKTDGVGVCLVIADYSDNPGGGGYALCKRLSHPTFRALFALHYLSRYLTWIKCSNALSLSLLGMATRRRCSGPFSPRGWAPSAQGASRTRKPRPPLSLPPALVVPRALRRPRLLMRGRGWRWVQRCRRAWWLPSAGRWTQAVAEGQSL